MEMKREGSTVGTWYTGGVKCSEQMGHSRISASRSYFRPCTSFLTISEEDAGNSAFLFAAVGTLMAIFTRAVATTAKCVSRQIEKRNCLTPFFLVFWDKSKQNFNCALHPFRHQMAERGQSFCTGRGRWSWCVGAAAGDHSSVVSL